MCTDQAQDLNPWFVYILRCADNSLYTGVTIDIQRRVDEHNGIGIANLGARYTRVRRPVKLVYQEEVTSRSEAGKREYEIKQMKKQQKEALLIK